MEFLPPPHFGLNWTEILKRCAMPTYPPPDFRPTVRFTADDLVKRDWQHCPEAMEGWGRVYEEDDARLLPAAMESARCGVCIRMGTEGTDGI